GSPRSSAPTRAAASATSLSRWNRSLLIDAEPNLATMMRAWRTHEYGRPLDEVEVPEPGPGEVRVKVQAIPLNLNDLERITGGNMMVEPELPYSPGMEVMGVVDVCGEGTEAWLGRRVEIGRA